MHSDVTILVAEDDEGHANLIKKNLRRAGIINQVLLFRDGQEIVDSRWIGHRLIGGYSSLRWTNNTGMYRSEPSKI